MPAVDHATSGTAQAARVAYELLAPYYDTFTEGYAHEVWVDEIERVLRLHDLGGKRVFDVACGTGKSTLPFLRRRYDVTACDISPGMVAAARRRLGLSDGRVFVADMRRLPASDLPYDLVTCLDDAVNYLLEEEDLVATFRGVAAVLRPGGALIFDVNSLLLFAQSFTADSNREVHGTRFHWRGAGDSEARPGGLFRATLQVVGARDRVEGSVAGEHIQRHHPGDVLRTCLEAAGLELLSVWGQATGAQLSRPADEDRHPKLLYVARRPREVDRRGQR